VSGGGKKPYKQKGTGRPQVGSSRTPLWRHGGTVFGPQVRSYDYRLPRKVKRAGIVAALAAKVQDGHARRCRPAHRNGDQNEGGRQRC
jgi:large subunit ribosomal protein L4